MNDLFAAAYVVLVFAVFIAAPTFVIVRALDRRGLLADPLPWEESPGGRNDRARLLEDQVR